VGGHLKEPRAGPLRREETETGGGHGGFGVARSRPRLISSCPDMSGRLGQPALAFIHVCLRLVPEPTASAERPGAVAGAAVPLSSCQGRLPPGSPGPQRDERGAAGQRAPTHEGVRAGFAVTTGTQVLAHSMLATPAGDGEEQPPGPGETRAGDAAITSP